MHVILKERVGI